jgi:glycosyltransferase involved in cell wall biosynthesis
MSLPLQFLKLRNILAQKKPDVLHSHRYKENIFASIATMTIGKKIKLIKTEHGSIEISSTFRMKIYRKIDLILTGYLFDKVIAVSDDIAGQCKRFLPKKSVLTIHNSICFDRYHIQPEIQTTFNSGNGNTGCLRMASIGRLVKIKNLDEFIKITADLKKNGLRIMSYIIGDGPEKDSLCDLALRLECTDCNEFVGNVDDISRIYNKIDILFITSLHEGVPTVLLEAMYFGKIVIARNVGGIPEIVKHNKNGFLYKDIEEAKYLVKSIFRNRSNFDSIRRNAHKTIKLNYSNMIQARKYAAVYK